jgi:tetratricopeptide (TPR) repeat protein
MPAAADGVPDPQQVITKHQKAIAADPELWLNYWALGLELVQTGGKFDEAGKVFLTYPGFHDRSPDDAVELSNDAFEAGDLFYWDGLTELARPLFKIAADLDTGSRASITSQARLQIFDGNYAGAAATFRDSAIRYSSAYDYRDYLSLLHAFGAHDEAWKAFSQLDSAFQLPHVWVSALVGQRMQGLKERDLRNWLMQPDIRDAHNRSRYFAPYYAVFWSLTDRTPPRDLAAVVQQLEGEIKGQIDSDGRTLLVPHPMSSDGGFMAVRPSPLRAGQSPKLQPGTRIKSELVYFAEAYATLRAGDYTKAAAQFSAMAERYPIEGYPLSYFAYAAAKSGDHEQLEKYVDSWKGYRGFDFWLAKAFFAGSRKDAAAAYEWLQNALRQHTWGDNDIRPALSEYQYAQACEWLYRETGDERFVKELLQWVTRYELVEPSQGWAYAMAYSHEKPGQARTRALAMTRYLDPASERIGGASKEELKAADAWFRANNPFRRPTTKSDVQRTS